MWQPGNLVARKFLKNQALAESFLIFLLHFLTSKQFGKSVKYMLLVFLENGNIFIHFYIISQKYEENLNCCTFMGRKYVILWTLSSPKIHLQTRSMYFFMSDSFIFAESFRPNPQVARNTFDFFHLCK